MQISKRALLMYGAGAGLSFGLGGGLAAPALAKTRPVTLKFANVMPPGHAMNTRAREAAARIKAQSDGAVDLQVYPNGQLGNSTNLLTQLRSGAIDFYVMGLELATLVPISALTGLGFAFSSYDQVWAALDGEVGDHIRDKINALGLVAMRTNWDNGFRHITTAHNPVDGPADLKGLQMRVPASPIWTSIFESFGTGCVSISFPEVYMALQTKVVEGQENPLPMIDGGRFYEVQKHCALTGHMWDGFYMIANGAVWNGLSADLQEIVAKNLNASALDERKDIAIESAALVEGLGKKGLSFNTPDKEPFRVALRESGYYDRWRKEFGTEVWSLLEKYTGTLG